MRSVFVLIVLIIITTTAYAQDKLIAATENGRPYIVKTITAGETMFSLSRSYSVAPKELAAFNKLDMAKPLAVGQAIKVPLSKGNLFLAPCTICVKVYYLVPPKEGLYRIAANFNNMGMPNLKKLNGLTADDVAIGQELLVGYLKEGETAAINIKPRNPETKENAETAVKTQINVKKEEEPVIAIKQPETKVDTPPVQPVKEKLPDEGMIQTNGSKVPEVQRSAFGSQYAGKKDNQQTGTAAIFKSTSGWNDNKFYVLLSSVPPGTIVKVSNPATSKTLFAKVLGQLPASTQNNGIFIRISNAAAAALGGGEDNMQVTIGY